MSFNTSITGAAITGLTTPTYTLAVDQAPAVNAKQWLVSALGGTQTGVNIHSVSYPFTVTVFRPIAPKQAPVANKATGIITNNPVNTYKVIFRKGGFINSTPLQLATNIASLTLSVPANMDAVDAVEVKALLSMIGGFFNGNAQAMADMVLAGTLS